jgi:hypothetical protein
VSQRTHSPQPYMPAFCPRCGTVTAHVRGHCCACDPCTAAILAYATTHHEPAHEEDSQPYERVMPMPAAGQ